MPSHDSIASASSILFGLRHGLARANDPTSAMAKNLPAPAKCVDAVEAALRRRFDEGMAVERELFVNLMFTPECKSLRHAFFAERR